MSIHVQLMPFWAVVAMVSHFAGAIVAAMVRRRQWAAKAEL